MRAKSIILLMGLLSCGIIACKRNEPTTWNTELLVPIAKGRITLDHVLTDSLLQADSAGLWHIILQQNATDFNLDSMVAIPDTTIKKVFQVPVSGGPYLLPNGANLFSQPNNHLLNLGNAQLKNVRIKSGKLQYAIKSYINGYLDCVYSIPGITYQGIGTIINATTEPKQGTTPFIHQGEIDLAGYEIDLTGQNGYMYNRVFTQLNITTMQNAPTQAMVYGQDSIVVEFQFINPKVEYAHGYFGQHQYNFNQSISLGNQLQMPQGAINIDDITMQVDIINAVGVDAQIHFNHLIGMNTHTQHTVALEHSPLFQTLNITRASEHNGWISNAPSYSYNLHTNNSNLDLFMENLPDSIFINADIAINPLGNNTDGNDFIYTSNTLKTLLKLDIPLKIGMNNLTFTDTLDLNSTHQIAADGQLKLYVKNYFPISAQCDLYLYHPATQTQTPLLSNGWINHATTINSLVQTQATESILVIPMNDEILRNLNPEHKLVIRVKLNTPTDQEHYGIYNSYYMDYKLIADGNLEVRYE